MVVALDQAAALADSKVPILIPGATGTGKDLLAKFVHRLSGWPPKKLRRPQLRQRTRRESFVWP